jgi:hypothetical protein
LVPNGVYLGEALGEDYSDVRRSVESTVGDGDEEMSPYWSRAGVNAFSGAREAAEAKLVASDSSFARSRNVFNASDEEESDDARNGTIEEFLTDEPPLYDDGSVDVLVAKNSHFWGLLFTIVGVILVDFCSDAAQSPSRTYMLDVTTPG